MATHSYTKSLLKLLFAQNLMNQSKILLKPGTLWISVKERTEEALASGALLSIPTEFEFVEQDGVNFLVRILSNLNRKKAALEREHKESIASGKEFNPFLPYQEDLFVADISDSHLCILNKYNVVDHHLLIITRAFEEQESLLTLADFAAMWACLADFDGLVFYNCGKVAGASQRHKHLQIVPLSGKELPISVLLKEAKFDGLIATIPGFPFLHAFTTLNSEDGGEITLESYYNLMRWLDLEKGYNLLATREWMLIVPRSHEQFASISVNSLGFAGALLVQNAEQMQLLKKIGPMNLLKQITF